MQVDCLFTVCDRAFPFKDKLRGTTSANRDKRDNFISLWVIMGYYKISQFAFGAVVIAEQFSKENTVWFTLR